jgi:hypothetical protein
MGEINNRQTSQAIPRLLWKLIVDYRVRKGPPIFGNIFSKSLIYGTKSHVSEAKFNKLVRNEVHSRERMR